MKLYSKIPELIGGIFVCIFWFIFIATAFLDATGSLTNIRLPLETVEHIAVDDQGNLFLGCSFYKRVLLYDKSGKFLKNFPAPYKLNGGFILAKDSSEDYHFIFRKDKASYKYVMESSEYNIKKNNTIYSIEHYMLFPSKVVIKSDSRKIIIKSSYFFYIFSPVPAFILGITGFILLNYRSKK